MEAMSGQPDELSFPTSYGSSVLRAVGCAVRGLLTRRFCSVLTHSPLFPWLFGSVVLLFDDP